MKKFILSLLLVLFALVGVSQIGPGSKKVFGSLYLINTATGDTIRIDPGDTTLFISTGKVLIDSLIIPVTTSPNADSLGGVVATDYMLKVDSDLYVTVTLLNDTLADYVLLSDTTILGSRIDLNTTHRTSDGSDHAFIDQSVVSGSSPTLDGTNITGINADTLNGDIDVSQVTGAISAVSVADSLKAGVTDSLLINTNALVVRTTGQIGMGISSPHASSLLDLTSDTLGFLIPRMTDVQRDAISTPAEGLEVYDLTGNVPNFYNGTSWRRFTHTTPASLEEGGIVISELTGGSSLITDSANFFWDNTSKRLGIGMSTPSQKLEVNGNIKISGDTLFNGTDTATIAEISINRRSYADLHASDSSITLSMTQNNYAHVTNPSNTLLSADHAKNITIGGDSLVATIAGIYRIDTHISLQGNTNDIYEGVIAIANVINNDHKFTHKTANNDVVDMSFSGLYILTASQSIKMMLRNTANNNNATIVNACLVMNRIDQ